MALSALDDKSKTPTENDLRSVLGSSITLWNDLKGRIAAAHDPVDEQWGFAGKKWGWSLRLKRKKRTILYLTPGHDHFKVGFALGERAVEAVRQAGLPAAVMRVVDEAQKYAEGRAVRLDVSTEADVDAVERIAAAKMAN